MGRQINEGVGEIIHLIKESLKITFHTDEGISIRPINVQNQLNDVF